MKSKTYKRLAYKDENISKLLKRVKNNIVSGPSLQQFNCFQVEELIWQYFSSYVQKVS
jgi:hypothetical protein